MQDNLRKMSMSLAAFRTIFRIAAAFRIFLNAIVGYMIAGTIFLMGVSVKIVRISTFIL